MYTALSGSEQGLVAYYNFDQGSPGGTNESTTTLNDLKGNFGALFGFSLTGSTSNWVTNDMVNQAHDITFSQIREEDVTFSFYSRYWYKQGCFHKKN